MKNDLIIDVSAVTFEEEQEPRRINANTTTRSRWSAFPSRCWAVLTSPPCTAATIMIVFMTVWVLWSQAVDAGWIPSLNTSLSQVLNRGWKQKTSIVLSHESTADLPAAAAGKPQADVLPQVPPVETGIPKTQLVKVERNGARVAPIPNGNTNATLDVVVSWPAIWRAQSAGFGSVVMATTNGCRFLLSKNQGVLNLTAFTQGASLGGMALRLDITDPELATAREALPALQLGGAFALFVPCVSALEEIKGLADRAVADARTRYPQGCSITSQLRWSEDNEFVFEILSVTPTGGPTLNWPCQTKLSPPTASAYHRPAPRS